METDSLVPIIVIIGCGFLNYFIAVVWLTLRKRKH